MWSVSCVKIVLIDKNILKEKIGRHLFVVYALIYSLSKFGGKLPKSFSSLQCPLWVKKLIQENRAKYVNQTGNFYFQPKLKTAISLPIFHLFQWLLFSIRDFICHYFKRNIEIWRKLRASVCKKLIIKEKEFSFSLHVHQKLKTW